jgi:hypothetical protein
MPANLSAINSNRLQILLGIFLLAAAPFSFNPSWALPLEGLVSFRIGLYQLIVLTFVLLMAPLAWQNRQKLLKDYWLSVPCLVLTLLLLSSPFRSYNANRSILFSGSILLLLALLISGVVFARNVLSNPTIKVLGRAVVLSSLAVGVFAVLQLIVNTFATKSLGLCANCGAGVFGFPRVNGFAAEPQFFASSLLPALLLLAAQGLRAPFSRRVILGFSFLTFVLTLTLSRGGYVAATAGTVSLVLILHIKRQLIWERVFILGITGIVSVLMGLTALTVSATIRHHQTNRTIAVQTMATIVEHSSGGVIDLSFNDPTAEPRVPGGFQTPGAIKTSHQDRESAASLGLKWWRKNVNTILVGLGGGNLGSFATHQNLSLPLSFTIYMQYVFILVELGVLGLVSFLVLLAVSIRRAIQQVRKGAPVLQLSLGAILIAFMVHYLFFGTYINVPYVWLYTGLGLGLTTQRSRDHSNE